MKKVLIVGLGIVVLLVLAACSQKNNDSSGTDTFEKIRQQHIANAGSDFERLCYENHHSWMKMAPRRNVVSTGDQPCLGCMIDAKTHICDEQEYLKYIGKERAL